MHSAPINSHSLVLECGLFCLLPLEDPCKMICSVNICHVGELNHVERVLCNR